MCLSGPGYEMNGHDGTPRRPRADPPSSRRRSTACTTSSSRSTGTVPRARPTASRNHLYEKEGVARKLDMGIRYVDAYRTRLRTGWRFKQATPRPGVAAGSSRWKAEPADDRVWGAGTGGDPDRRRPGPLFHRRQAILGRRVCRRGRYPEQTLARQTPTIRKPAPRICKRVSVHGRTRLLDRADVVEGLALAETPGPRSVTEHSRSRAGRDTVSVSQGSSIAAATDSSPAERLGA